MPAGGNVFGGKDEDMEKMILASGELTIEAGASLGGITVAVESFAGLQEVADMLMEEGALGIVKFKSGKAIVGEYENLKLEAPLFQSVDYTSGGKVSATFSLRQKTELEIEIESLKKGQAIQDGALADLGDMISTITEGGAV